MKVQVEKAELYEALQKVQNIVSSKTTVSILSNVLLETLEDNLIFTATDLQVGIRCKAKTKVEEEGSSTLPGRKLFEILRELSDGEVEISVDGKNEATITSGASIFRMKGLSRDEFPKLPEFADSESFELPQDLLRKMVRNTAYAISREDSRYVLMGLYFVIDGGTLRLISTDGKRLSKIEGAIGGVADGSRDFIVPLKAVDELNRMLGTEGDVKIFLAKNQVAFQIGETLLVSRLIDGSFPDYQRVIPEESQESVEMDRQELASLVRQAALMTSEQSSSVKLGFQPEKLEITSSTPDVGFADVNMPIKYEGKETEIAFNPDYLKDVLTNLEEETVTLEFTDSLSPGVLKGGESFLHVIMPVRIEGEAGKAG